MFDVVDLAAWRKQMVEVAAPLRRVLAAAIAVDLGPRQHRLDDGPAAGAPSGSCWTQIGCNTRMTMPVSMALTGSLPNTGEAYFASDCCHWLRCLSDCHPALWLSM